MNAVQVKAGVIAELYIGDALETDGELYNFICNHEDCTIYEISKHLNWSTSKVTQSVKRLIDANMVREKEEVVSGSVMKVVVPVKWTEHFTEAELEEIKGMKFL
ncbi:MAG: helix-turn-helix domain-containing protein [Halobacteriota archaeon]